MASITRCNIKLFADDTSLYIEFNKNEDVSDTVNDDLNRIQSWADKWLVKFSATKTKLMTCTNKKNVYSNIIFNNVNLSPVKSHKHLGLTLRYDLTWTEHVNNIVQGISSMSDVLKRLKYDIDRNSLEDTYITFIRPKLEYDSQVWDNCTQRDADLLESIQLDMARVVTGARKGTSHDLLYRETNWQTLAERRELIKFKHFIKIVNKDAPLYLQSLLPNKLGDIRPNSRNALLL